MLKLIKKIIPGYAHLPLIICGITQILAYGATKLIPVKEYVDVSLAADHAIPVRSEWVLVYVLSYVYWVAGYIAISRVSRSRCRQLCRADYIAKVICAACFIFIPVTIERPVLENSGLFNGLLNLIYFFDSPYSLFPSMHCLFSWLIARMLVEMDEFPKWIKWGAAIFSVLVFISTLYTRQHYIADVLGGIVVAEAVHQISRITEKRKNREAR